MEKGSRRARKKMQRESEMIQKAEELFSRNGFEKTTMEDLSKQAEYTKRTIYKYFTCKEDLFFAVSRSNYELLWDGVRIEMAEGQNGFDRLRRAWGAVDAFYAAHPDKLMLICLTDLIKSKDPGVGMPNRKRFYQLNKLVLQELTTVFEEGIADGSIRGDIELKELVFMAVYTLVGFFRMEIVTGDTLFQEGHVDRNRFSNKAMELLTNIFRPAY